MNFIKQAIRSVADWEKFISQNQSYRHWEEGGRWSENLEQFESPECYPCVVVYGFKHTDGRAYIQYHFVYQSDF